ncbi:MAG: hypothetical protein Kow0027_13830 [Saprospiraceae bacterium]
MSRLLLFSVLLLFQTTLSAQSVEEAQVIATLSKLFDGMRAGDSAAVSSVFHPEARLQSAFISRDGTPVLAAQEISKFVEAVGTPHDEVWDEKIWTYDIRIDKNLATAWTDYTFYRGEEMSHCGVNAFQLFRDSEGWKIIQITDTRRRDGCITSAVDEKVAINQFLDNWHQAAANADEDTFFGSMTMDGVYLGTDASEYWRRDEMRKWAQPYFDKDTAWAFKPKSRHIYMSADGQIAWFDELLDTWMGDCRGSGVLVKTKDGWKLKHYNLAVTVPNDLMDQYLELLKAKPSKE